MKTYFGSYKVPGHQEFTDCSVLISEKKISIGYKDSVQQVIHWLVKDVAVEYIPSSRETRFFLKDEAVKGAVLLIKGVAAKEYIDELHAEINKPWRKRKNTKEWSRGLLLLSGITATLVLLYFLLVPWLAEKMASRISVSTEEDIGNSVYDALGLKEKEDAGKSLLLTEFFAAMDMPSKYAVRVTVVNDDVFNAFALPGGRIVVYSALLTKIKTYPELAALLSHEFIHVNNRHTTRSIFRRMGSRIFISLLFGRMGAVSAMMIDQADNLSSLKFSRKLEKEADVEGLDLILERKIDPSGFSDLFTNLKQNAPAAYMPELLASHPDIDARIKYIQKLSSGTVSEDNIHLKNIFEKISSNGTSAGY